MPIALKGLKALNISSFAIHLVQPKKEWEVQKKEKEKKNSITQSGLFSLLVNFISRESSLLLHYDAIKMR